MFQAFKSEAATKSYTYAGGNWGDRLTSYDGESITYDDAGYPINYRGHALTWNYGNLTRFGSTTFSYNDEGIRIGKGATEYFVKGSLILAEKRGSTVIHYYYDDSGVAGFEYNGQKYVYRKNLLASGIKIMRFAWEYGTAGNRIYCGTGMEALSRMAKRSQECKSGEFCR